MHKKRISMNKKTKKKETTNLKDTDLRNDNMVKWLIEHDFVVKHLFGNWYLVRLYADKSNLLYHIIFPMKLI